MHCLHHAMKMINDKLVLMTGLWSFRPIFSPSVTCLLKVLNVLRRSFELMNALTSLNLMNEKNGSIIGAMLQETNDLLDAADINLNYMRCSEGMNFKLDHAFCFEGGDQNHNSHGDVNDLQTKMSTFNVLFDVYKLLSIKLHRRDFMSFVMQCPTCTDGYLMKVELQTLIDSIQEFLPLSQSLMTNDDLLRFEKISPGCVTFMETQSGDRNFIQSFVTQADISRLSSDCDFVPYVLRISNFSKKQSMKSTQCRLMPDVTFRPERRMRQVLNSFSNRCLISQTNKSMKAFMDRRNVLDQLECYMDWFLSLICKNYIFKHFVKTVEPTSLKFCTIIELITLHLEYTIAQVKYANFSYAHAQTFVLLNEEMATVSTDFRKLKFWLWLLRTVFYLNQTGF